MTLAVPAPETSSIPSTRAPQTTDSVYRNTLMKNFVSFLSTPPSTKSPFLPPWDYSSILLCDAI